MVKGKARPIAGHEGPHVPLGARWSGWSTQLLGRFTPGKDIRCPFHIKLSVPRGLSERIRKNSSSLGFEPRTNVKGTCIYTRISTKLSPRNRTGCLLKENRFVYSLHILIYSKLQFSLLLHTHKNTHTHKRRPHLML
jgi:hypothetical protein